MAQRHVETRICIRHGWVRVAVGLATFCLLFAHAGASYAESEDWFHITIPAVACFSNQTSNTAPLTIWNGELGNWNSSSVLSRGRIPVCKFPIPNSQGRCIRSLVRKAGHRRSPRRYGKRYGFGPLGATGFRGVTKDPYRAEVAVAGQPGPALLNLSPACLDACANLRKRSGMVHITRLTAALRQCLWRQGFVEPEPLEHTREPNGDHRFTVVIPQSVCEYELPAPTPSTSLGYARARSRAMASASLGARPAARRATVRLARAALDGVRAPALGRSH